jgi:hypothetical protein
LKKLRNPDSLKNKSDWITGFFKEASEFEVRNIPLMFWVAVLLGKGGEKRND